METDELTTETIGQILVITMNRPPARNAMTLAMANALAKSLDTLDESPDLRLAILTGAGGTFCSGMDLKGFLKGERPLLPGRGFGGLTERPPRKVLIAAVEGHAIGGGFELALACDLIVSSEQAKFGLPEVRRGLVASAGGLMHLPSRIPFHVAMEFALTGDMLGAGRAHQLGLVNRLAPPGQALKAALELAQAIEANGPLAVNVSKQVILESREWSRHEMFDKQKAVVAPVFKSADAMEGAAAFAEKRAPVWRGH